MSDRIDSPTVTVLVSSGPEAIPIRRSDDCVDEPTSVELLEWQQLS